jgi:hypothetical protein
LDSTPANLRRFRRCEPVLHDGLCEIVWNGVRSVWSIRELAVLPPGTVFYEEPLSFDGMPGVGPTAIGRRLGHRSDWVRRALKATRRCDVVFADPDNGLESGTPCNHKSGPKFAYFDELAPYLDRDQSVVYHQLHSSYSTKEQVRERLAQIGEQLGETFALLYKRDSPRTFFMVPSVVHTSILVERARRFVEGCWSQHFVLVGMGGGFA